MDQEWLGKHYSFFQNRECEYFPCHEVKHPENFNCLFCYCPLYALGDRCGGNFQYTEKGIKDCSACTVPHRKEAYGYILSRFQEVAELARKKSAENGKNAENCTETSTNPSESGKIADEKE